MKLDDVRFVVGGQPILAGVSFDVARFRFACILGPSGCGKTTLLRIVGGLLSPTSGSVQVAGVNGPGPNQPGRVRHDVAYVFQSARLAGWRTVAQNVALGMELRQPSLPAARRRERVEQYLRMVGLWDRREQFAGTLSGGEAQRVALARALAVEASILLMDEPFASLDIASRENLQQQLLAVWSEARRTILFVTHDIDEALLLADDVIVLSDRPGRVVERVAIDLPRPRQAGTGGFEQWRERLRRRLLPGAAAGSAAAGAERSL